MITKQDIGPFERPVACVWVIIRLEQRAVTSPVTSPKKPKPEFETVSDKIISSRIYLFGYCGAYTRKFMVSCAQPQNLGSNGQNGPKL